MNTHHDMTNGEIVIKGGVGTSASFGAWYISHLQHVNGALQTASLILGLIIGVVSLVKLLRKKHRKSNTP